MGIVSIINVNNLGVVDEELEWNSIEELAAIISTNQWAPGVFKERRRLIANLSKIDLLVLDVDASCTLEDAKQHFRDYKHIIATSRNHQKEKNGVVCDRYRVVLFLEESINSDGNFKATWSHAFRLFPFIDPACKDSARFFYSSCDVVSLKREGRNFLVSVEINNPRIQSDESKEVNRSGLRGELLRGDLWKSTLRFFLEGAPPGSRHVALRDACLNMKEQGYTPQEAIDKLQHMIDGNGDWTTTVTKTDLKTIEACFARETKYPFSPIEEEKKSTPIIVNAAELLDETFSYLADKDKVKGEPTGIEGLDAMLGGGAREGEITVLMARAKTGKNTLYHYMMHTRLERGLQIGYASRELDPASEVIPNLLSIAMHENAWNAEISEAYQSKARQVIARWGLYFAPGYGYFPASELEKWFKLCVDQGVRHFVFDHFHYALMSEDHESVAALIKLLKSLVKELKIHLDLIVQPRGLREGEVMSLATLRGGAVIGQALDNLLIFERVKGEENVSKLTLEVARHKLASLGYIYLQYDRQTTSFTEVDRRLVSEIPVPMGIKRPWSGHQIET